MHKLAYWLRAAQHPLQFMRRRAVERCGLEYNVYRLYNRRWLLAMDFDMILDVGAARGAHSLVLHHLFPRAELHAFEPLAGSYEQLARNLSSLRRVFAHNVALADVDGRSPLYVADSSHRDASSLMPMTASHTHTYPGTRVSGVDTVQTRRLDSLLALGSDQRALVKLDVQGGEACVVTGGPEFFRRTSVIIVEVSFRQLYEGALSFEELYDLLRHLGFAFRGALSQDVSPQTGEIRQADLIFVGERPPLSAGVEQ
jgi:FkbM family methyltransferase